jgi:hypothetical protein
VIKINAYAYKLLVLAARNSCAVCSCDVDCGVPYVFDSLHAGTAAQQVSKSCLVDAVLPRRLFRRSVALLDEFVYSQLTALEITWISAESDILFIPFSAARMARLVAAAKLAVVPSAVDDEMEE